MKFFRNSALGLGLALMLGIAYYLFSVRPEQASQVSEPAALVMESPAESVLPPAHHRAQQSRTAAPSQVAPRTLPVEPQKKADVIAIDEDTQSELQQFLKSFEPLHSSAGIDASRKIHAWLPLPAQRAAFFEKELRQVQGDQRDRLIWLANAMQGPELLNFWQDIAERRVARSKDEDKIRSGSHPTLDSRFVDIEQLQAIRNIGLIAHERPEARELLITIASQPSPGVFGDMHRERAFVALKETDPSAVLRVLRALAADDPLRSRLRLAVQAESEEP